VLTLGSVEPEGARHRVQHLGARVDLAALFQPRVPRDADPREQGNLLAAQPRRAPPRAARHVEILGRQPRTARLEKIAQFLPAPLEHRRALPGLVGNHVPSPHSPAGARLTRTTDIPAAPFGHGEAGPSLPCELPREGEPGQVD